ncbi:MAG: ABC transporter permease, partial [Acidobacteriota bacterium]
MRPPRIAAKLLDAVLPRELRDDVLGDLQEGFGARLATDGPTVARRWYWRQALHSLRWVRGANAPEPPRRPRASRLRRAFMGFLHYDLAYAFRQLRANPGFTAVAVLSLAIGIGANSTIFAVINGFLFKPLPVRDIDQVVEVFSSLPEQGPYNTISYPDYLDLRDGTDAFSGAAAGMIMPYNWNRETHSETIFGELVTDNYFEVLGVQPHLGRWFLPEENATLGTHPVAVLAYGFWQRAFGADPQIVGKTIKLNGAPFTIVGVAPAEFGGMMPVLQLDLWTPLMSEPLINMFSFSESFILQRGSRSLRMFGRLADGATIDGARAQLETVAARLADEYPETNRDRSVTVTPLSEVRVNPAADAMVFPVATLLMGLVGLVLLVACANVANMMLARCNARSREIGVRLAIGAGRWRLVRQLLTESILVSLIGGAMAL